MVRMLSKLSIVISLIASCSAAVMAQTPWKPAAGPLLTRFAKDVDPAAPLPDYPRPTLVRDKWSNLNGLWDYAVTAKSDQLPEKWDGRILVPFPVESALSGVMRHPTPEQRLWYRRAFHIPADWPKDWPVMLRFGAVDWECSVRVDGTEVGRHRGGYDGFACDITAALGDRKDHELIVAVDDPTDAGFQPRGKQVNKPEGIWYTATSGIWQTVWLEPVPPAHIESVRAHVAESGDGIELEVVTVPEVADVWTEVEVSDPALGSLIRVRTAWSRGQLIDVPLEKPHRWSPADPFLYSVRVRLLINDKLADAVETYAALRTVDVGADAGAPARIRLNGQPLFLLGPLDQGFWPDGLYTAPTDAALKSDIEKLKALGFNAARKHVKVEPERWYYWCDKLGLAVIQDMPSGDCGGDGDRARSAEAAANFEKELRALIDGRRAYASILAWVVFNEGWGQHDTKRYTDLVKAWDPTRIVSNASGWTDRACGDVLDIHVYPGPGKPEPKDGRAAVLGEYGGLGHPVPGHTWKKDGNWGYVAYPTRDSLTDAYVELLDGVRDLAHAGLSAAIYTQTSDVEVEVNGILTYDRETKFDEARVAAANRAVFVPPVKPTVVIPTSVDAPQTWRYALSEPATGWEKPGFDDAAWAAGEGGFGTAGTPGAVVKTEWKTAGIWLRRKVTLAAGVKPNAIRIHHDEDVEVYVNGVLVFRQPGYSTSYVTRSLAPAIQDAFTAGENVIAVHCRQTNGGQYIDVGFVKRD